jgi:DMSO/TMAO reductase YedYZ molybdopterin-dependent catalytic subunit
MTAASPAPGSVTPEGRIVRLAEPQNEEFDLGRLSGPITPNEQFYVRSHGPVPAIDPASWRLTVDGLVDQPLSLSLDDLRSMLRRDETATLECAGNRRTFQQPIPPGVPWQDGAVSTALWEGIPLAAVLDRARVSDSARHVLLEGADLCPTDAGPALFARSIPLELARDPGTLLAYSMNGVPLPPEHGAPVRVVVPRYYAMNCVKWVTRITATTVPHTGYFQANDYLLWFSEDDPGREIGPVRVMATIGRPRPGTTLAVGRTTIAGAAWTGTGAIERVEISTDGGQTWSPASLGEPSAPGVWRLWTHEWDVTPGAHTLMARATDSEGNTQPDSLPPNRKGYANNVVLRIPVEAV